jgi:hypothetical protein
MQNARIVFVGPPVIVAADPSPQARPKRVPRGVLLQLDFLILGASPKPLDEDIVHPASFAVHADVDAGIKQIPGPFRGGELASLRDGALFVVLLGYIAARGG